MRVKRAPSPQKGIGRGALSALLLAGALLCVLASGGGAGGSRLSSLGGSARSTLDRIETRLGNLRHSGGQRDSLAERLTRRGLEERLGEVGGGARVITATPDRPAARRTATLVLYVYNAADEEQRSNFAFFVRWGMQADDGTTYRIILTRGPGVLPLASEPALPPNAAYVRTDACVGTWGALGAVKAELPLAASQYYVVVDSSVRGPFIPGYAQHALHWTEAFTSRLGPRVGLVGAAISCEGAPRGGDAAGEWRANAYVLPYAWATHQRGWELLRADPQVFRCHADAWDARYHGDSGASLAVLRAGLNLDCLLTRYQGVDWVQKSSWRCNERVRPDAEMTYDGVSLTPYETVFVPFSAGGALNNWTFVEQAAQYQRYLEQQASGSPDIASNAFVNDAWEVKGERLIYMNARGPGCFDFRFYVAHNPDLADQAGNPLALWEHFLLLGQFQGRLHRFSCPVMVGNSYRLAYARSRGQRCFDHNYYLSHNPDLAAAGLKSSADLWGHYVGFGQFEQRPVKYTCADTVTGLTKGFETLPVDAVLGQDKHTEAEQQQLEALAAARQAGAAAAADPQEASAAAASDAAAMQQIQGTAELEWARLKEKETAQEQQAAAA